MKGSEVDVGLVMATHEIEGVWAKGIPGFERLGKKRGEKCGGIAIYIRKGIAGTDRLGKRT